MRILSPVLLVVVSALPVFCSQAYVSLCCGPHGSISAFNPQTNQLSGTGLTLPGAVDMVLSPDGTKAYVATSASGQSDVPPGASNSLVVYQLSTPKLLQRIALTVSPTEIVINTAGDHVFAVAVVPNTGAHQVLSIDLGTALVTAAPLPSTTPFDLLPIAVSPDGTTLYTGSATKKALTVLNASTLTQTGAIALTGTTGTAPPVITADGKTLALIVGTASGPALDIVNLTTQQVTAVALATRAFPFGLALSPDGSTVYVNGSQVVAIDVATGAILGAANTKSQNPYRMAITPDGSTLYAADLTAGVTRVVAVDSLTVTSTLRTLAGAYKIAFNPQGLGYVLNENGSAVLRVDTSAMKVVGAVPVAAGLAQVAVNAGGPEAFVLNAGSGNVSAVRYPDTAISAIPVPIGLGPVGMAFLDHRLYVLSIAALNTVDPLTLQLGTPIAPPLPDPLADAVTGFMAASPTAPYLFIPYLATGDDSITGGGLIVYNPETLSAPTISSGSITGGPLAVSFDGSHVYSAGSVLFTPPNNTLLDFSITGMSLAQSVAFGSANYVALALSIDGSTLYCVDSGGKVDLISTASFALIASIPAGVQPGGIAISADGTQALLTDSASNSITVV